MTINYMFSGNSTITLEKSEIAPDFVQLSTPLPTLVSASENRPLGLFEAKNLQFANLCDAEYDNLQMMRDPMELKTSLNLYGLFLGLATPAALVAKVAFVARQEFSPGFVLIGMLMVITGAISGWGISKLFVRGVDRALSRSISEMIFISFVIGLLWGALAGGCSGLWFFGFGAVPGSFAGAVVGAITFPPFLALCRLLSYKHSIEFSHLLPITIGLAATVAALIMGI